MVCTVGLSLQEHSCPVANDETTHKSRMPGIWKIAECQMGMSLPKMKTHIYCSTTLDTLSLA